MHPSDQSDSDLWLSVRNNDGKAFNVLFDRHWLKLYKVALQQIKDEDTSLEIVHNVFVSLWNRREKLEIRSVKSFLNTSIKYQIYNNIRLRKLRIVYKADLNGENSPTELNQGALKIQDHELLRKLDVSLSQLPVRCSQIFRLSRMENLSNREIADHLGITQKSVENQMTIALKHLRHALKDIVLGFILIYFLWPESDSTEAFITYLSFL